MEPYLMLQASTWLFVATGLGGVVMALIRFSSSRNPPSWLAMLHGFLGAAGLTLLVYAVLTSDVPNNAFLALLLFLAAAAGGVVLNLAYHLRAVQLPKWLIAVHGLVAVLALVLLYLAAFPDSAG